MTSTVQFTTVNEERMTGPTGFIGRFWQFLRAVSDCDTFDVMISFYSFLVGFCLFSCSRVSLRDFTKFLISTTDISVHFVSHFGLHFSFPCFSFAFTSHVLRCPLFVSRGSCCFCWSCPPLVLTNSFLLPSW